MGIFGTIFKRCSLKNKPTVQINFRSKCNPNLEKKRL